MRKNPSFGVLTLVTYALVIGVTLIATASYYYFRSNLHAGEQADPNPMRRIEVGAVWVPIYKGAVYVEPAEHQQKEITTGSVKFRTPDPLQKVLDFYRETLSDGGLVTFNTGDNGATIQAVSNGGRTSVQITLLSSATNTTGEIHTLRHVETSPK